MDFIFSAGASPLVEAAEAGDAEAPAAEASDANLLESETRITMHQKQVTRV